ncbi:glycosyltransferase family 2 protein [Aaosphaeria arxii CBS 175.79]|uniref:chitin synthase n=1 Tax=Aaosphaeria arxii CBS 175.79 TaxID=1450172 RepID=A0A6A5XBP1_9PLEO|nr:glycosyltransferase family 2 protein [Aaosphaeria arxii CBS 175.79]KAF2010309.1 glycosyltransferase family 2 protein [Aaosphaeria arxii CBS 175.79]
MSFVNNNSRMSVYSTASAAVPRPANPSSQVSTTTLLNALHTSFSHSQPYNLEASTSLVVNTWVNARSIINERIGGTVDLELGRKAWEHARRRAEDGCIVLGSLHESTPSLFSPFISGLPLSIPESFYTSLEALRAFTHCVTPQNPSYPRHSSLAAIFTINLQGNLVGAEIKLSTSGIDTKQGLLQIPAEAGFRAFDAFYYLNSSSASKSEREWLNLRHPSEYSLLNRSGTYDPPSYLPDADDAAAAEDFRANLKAIGFKGNMLQNLLSALAGLLKLGDTLGYLIDEEMLQSICEECGALLDINPLTLQQKLSANDREVAIGGIYEAIVDRVILQANATIKEDIRKSRAPFSANSSDIDQPGILTPPSEDELGDIVNITVVEVPSKALGKAIALRTIFDDSDGINSEMKEDGVPFTSAGTSVLENMREAVQHCEADLGVEGAAYSQRQVELERREVVLEKIALDIPEEDNFVKEILMPIEGEGVVLGKQNRFDLPMAVASSRVWFHLALHPNDSPLATLTQDLNKSWNAGTLSRQLRDLRLPEWANRRNRSLDFTADFDHQEFYERYHLLGCMEGKDGIQNWILTRGWSNGEVVVGHQRVWMREGTWWEAESQLDLKGQEVDSNNMLGNMVGAGGLESGYSTQSPGMGSGFFPPLPENVAQDSQTHLLGHRQSQATLGARSGLGAKSIAPTTAPTMNNRPGDYGLGSKGDENKGITYYDAESGGNMVVTEQPITFSRKVWVAFVWALTFWIPSPVLKWVGRMKRPDVRMAWREKLVLVFMILVFNGAIIFYIVIFGKLLCPLKDKVWDRKEVGFHQGESDYWVSHRGVVYDLTDFWRRQHSDMNIKTTSDNMMPFAGFDMDPYIMPPLNVACPKLVTGDTLQLIPNTTVENANAQHISGKLARSPKSALAKNDWYPKKFLPKMEEYKKGDLVWEKKKIEDEGKNLNHMWFTMGNRVYDLTDYFNTLDVMDNYPTYQFLDSELQKMVSNYAGTDLKEEFENKLNATAQADNLDCLDRMFYIGKTDFRKSAKCQVNDYILLAVAIILCTVIGVKFLAALQLGSKRRPANQDKFVICQVPAYTEGEDQLRKGLDSLTALAYDNKRKLICVICDGMIVGGGNDRPTPKIVLDILGVDPKVDPPALPFWSVGTGSEQLNYGKVYSGLYEFEGNVVPYVVVVKMGKESEQSKSKPGNRGKRDSQILLMSFLNRVHHRSAMNPLELEMFHQINNIIGVDPELYEYLLMVDADTMVQPDSLNRLVASCANDSKIAGICGETSLENEERSWWTMIQVYEYYISHNLSKAFESLFGSVTCLPGCFCMYRIRTADKGKPLIISDKVIKEYADCVVDTLHKKNLLSLGEDRYLTTLMTKHFPSMSYKFIPDAYAFTAAPETFSILLSQRRRWINSTIHNLAELFFLKDMCGFCCFSMRFVVFIDLIGTLMLPSMCGYLVYLIYLVASKTGQFPLISIIMLAAVYGLQAIIFLIKRQWQHIGWMIIYILAFPIFSLVLPLYSFWKQDDFSWGNTRVVIGEKGAKKQVLSTDDEGFDPKSIPLQRWDDYAQANGLPGRRGLAGQTSEKGHSAYDDDGYEMNDMQSIYSSVKPASTIMSNMHHISHMPPQSPGPYQGLQTRQSTYSNFSRYQDHPQGQGDGRLMSMGGMSDHYNASPYGNRPGFQSSDNLMASTPPVRGRSPLGHSASRPGSTANFQSLVNGPTDAQITEVVQACLREADLDRVTKKQLVALAEQRLQTQLTGERRIFLNQQIDLELANML